MPDPVLAELEAIETELESSVRSHESDIDSVHACHRQDAVNLCHYLALRRHDVRLLQRELTKRGLSSLGRCEPHVMATLLAVLDAARGNKPSARSGVLDFEAGRKALDTNTDDLFGKRPRGRVPRIMVTLPTEASVEYELVRGLVGRGMDVARINGAHDGPSEWELMAANVKRASTEMRRSCLISVDLPGPKLRTGPLQEGPRVIRLKPERDLRGAPICPAEFELVPDTTSETSNGPPTKSKAVPVAPSWLCRRRPGERAMLADTRGSARQVDILQASPGRCGAEVWDTTYLETGTVLEVGSDRTSVGSLPPLEQFHLLQAGDVLRLTSDLHPARPWRRGLTGIASIGCSFPAVFGSLRQGHRVLFDDGKLSGVVEQIGNDHADVRIHAPAKPARLRAEKGINFPDTNIGSSIVTPEDEALLEFAAQRADMIALSFLRHENEIDAVREALEASGGGSLALVLKIETAPAFARLPKLLFKSMESPTVGVMIARGDLAVEAGYPRLAELQEEILWLCEAAHLPVIWATEVLDGLARTGRPSRAEVTDAAVAQQAECIMLNKGPFVGLAIEVLDDILTRMAGHQRKKASLLRSLNSWI
jgi:pyruvate kinase